MTTTAPSERSTRSTNHGSAASRRSFGAACGETGARRAMRRTDEPRRRKSPWRSLIVMDACEIVPMRLVRMAAMHRIAYHRCDGGQRHPAGPDRLLPRAGRRIRPMVVSKRPLRPRTGVQRALACRHRGGRDRARCLARAPPERGRRGVVHALLAGLLRRLRSRGSATRLHAASPPARSSTLPIRAPSRAAPGFSPSGSRRASPDSPRLTPPPRFSR